MLTMPSSLFGTTESKPSLKAPLLPHKQVRPLAWLHGLNTPAVRRSSAKYSSALLKSAARATLPACCEQRLAFVSAHKKGNAVVYKLVKTAALRKQTSIVGSHRVPFYPIHNAHHRVQRARGSVLGPIDEEGSMCDACHVAKFNRSPVCVGIRMLHL
ncbi:Aste57867_139 [Aphanomyces stellatus]|uniref:Aste57867_139 protein n=1 Tax=Aphanomyces stellatus TaxID=120398 RepID=A0A485K6U1_9STRA|nr:hypothetical protein As57867_000139 [Aphanomyces stellatus]VFT77365.1 Aste57867_139 [Aphanomyces stellatus]